MTSQQRPLALPPTSQGGQGFGWRRNAQLIDALPYIDTLTPEAKSQVDALIEEECKRSSKKPSEYLQELPPVPPPRFEGHPILAAEYERVKSKQPMDKLDTTRYRLDPPPATRRSDFSAWQASLNNAHAQLEHQYNRIQNLELLLKYGDKSWRGQAQQSEVALKQLEAEVAATRKEMTKLNQERKLSQLAAGNELRHAHDEYFELLQKNHDIESACAALEEEIDQLKARLAQQQGKQQPAEQQDQHPQGQQQQQQASDMDVHADGGQQQQQQAQPAENGVNGAHSAAEASAMEVDAGPVANGNS